MNRNELLVWVRRVERTMLVSINVVCRIYSAQNHGRRSSLTQKVTVIFFTRYNDSPLILGFLNGRKSTLKLLYNDLHSTQHQRLKRETAKWNLLRIWVALMSMWCTRDLNCFGRLRKTIGISSKAREARVTTYRPDLWHFLSTKWKQNWCLRWSRWWTNKGGAFF